MFLKSKEFKISETKPPEFYMDPSDDNLLLVLPDELTSAQQTSKSKEANNIGSVGATTANNESEQQKKAEKLKLLEKSKQSKNLTVGGNKLRSDEIEESESTHAGDLEPSTTNANENSRNKFWNISNDEHYNPKTVVQETTSVQQPATTTKHVSTALTLQHTRAALELNTMFFPTHLSNHRLRNFHRYPLKPLANLPFSSGDGGMSGLVRSLLRKFKPTMEKPQFQLNFSSKIIFPTFKLGF